MPNTKDNLFKLTPAALLTLAQDQTVSTKRWANFMKETHDEREHVNTRHLAFYAGRKNNEGALKVLVILTFSVGVFLSTASALPLLGGGALALTLSNLICAQITPNKTSVVFPAEEPAIDYFNEAGWAEYRKKWFTEAQHIKLQNNEKYWNVNLDRAIAVIVFSFAGFVAVSSGIVTLPIAAAAVGFCCSLLFENYPDDISYLENKNALPTLTTTPTMVG